MHGTLITVGTELYFPTAAGGAGNGPAIRRGVVAAIEEPSHRGYGYWTRRLKIRKADDGKIATMPYPANCLVITSPPPAGAAI
jgi:hypothetical protein